MAENTWWDICLSDKRYNTEPDFSGRGVDFSVPNIQYDANGNITEMDQKGWLLSESGFVDQLRYSYSSDGRSNKLVNVRDISPFYSLKLGDFTAPSLHPQYRNKTITSVNYSYDDNGNLRKSANDGRRSTYFFSQIIPVKAVIFT